MDAMFEGGAGRPGFAPRGWANRIDWSLVFSALSVVTIGIIYVAGATLDSRGSGMAIRQLLYAAAGAAAMIGIMRLDYRKLLNAAPLLYLATLLLLCGVLFTRPVNGARSWYDLKIVRFQPSEIAKIVTVLTLAYYIMYRDNYRRLSGLAVPLAIAAVPMGLILKQPDLGTTIVFVPMFAAMLFAAGARLIHLAAVGAAGAAGLAAMWFTIMKDYQKRRVLAWLFPDQYRSAEAWQLIQAQAA
ncbi:MAG: FtsW/RodA/SpoVE family cell cycle protein, partial [Planctomycetota bacterium]|nr:FtsW/RodA/SpoVE family cell cycle protein [Planctomycetota bacterium]